MHSRPLALALFLVPWTVRAQSAASSDLWRVATGTLTVPAALADGGSAPFWTPAVTLPLEARFRFGAEAVHGPSEVGVNGGIVAFTARAGRFGLASLSYGRIGIGDIAYTETSPEAIGTVPVWSQQVSLGLAGTARPFLTAGLAARYVSGRAGTLTQSQLSLDVGAAYNGIPHVRLGFTTSLLDPAFSANQDAASWNIAAEYRSSGFAASGVRASAALRYGITVMGGENAQHLISGTLDGGPVALDIGVAHESLASDAVWRSRFALVVKTLGYRVEIGRDGGVNDFGAAYRFALTMVFR